MNAFEDYYAVLGVRSDAETEVIRAAYRALSQRYHPDKATPEEREEACRRMAAINAAYEVLGDRERRAAYDRRRVDEPPASSDHRSASPARPRQAVRHLAHALIMGLAVALALIFGVEEKSGLRVAWEWISSGFEKPSHYIVHWHIVAPVVGAGWLVARWAADRIAVLLQ